MLKSIIRVAMFSAVVLCSGVGGAATQDWCIPGDDCTGPIPITASGFSTCEENCQISNPVAIRGLDATLFDVSCKGDWGGLEYRMIVGEFDDGQGNRRAYIVRPDGPEELERCPL